MGVAKKKKLHIICGLNSLRYLKNYDYFLVLPKIFKIITSQNLSGFISTRKQPFK